MTSCFSATPAVSPSPRGCRVRGAVAVAPALSGGGPRPSSHRGSIPAAKAPHFSRLGDVEVNAGQNASFQCMAAGRAAEAERFLLQVRGWRGPYQGGRGDFFWDLGSLQGAGLFLHFPAFILRHPCPHPGSALLSWVLLLPSGQRVAPQTTLHQRQRPHSLNHLLIHTFLRRRASTRSTRVC